MKCLKRLKSNIQEQLNGQSALVQLLADGPRLVNIGFTNIMIDFSIKLLSNGNSGDMLLQILEQAMRLLVPFVSVLMGLLPTMHYDLPTSPSFYTGWG